MLNSFLAEEIAREHHRALSANAVRAAQVSRDVGLRRKGVRAAVGLRLVRVGLRLAGGSAAAPFSDTAQA